MQESTVTSKGQTTLPKDVRTALQLHPGDRVRYLILDGGEVRIVRSQPVMRLAGLFKGQSGRRLSLEDMEEAIAQGAAGE
jgi:AbrB family looped-hinge helix DNA binding protein